MPPVVVAAIIGATAAFGATELVEGLSKGSKASPEQAALPNQAAADQAGSTTVQNQRQLLLAAGGQTDYTDGLGSLTGADVSSKSLVGG